MYNQTNTRFSSSKTRTLFKIVDIDYVLFKYFYNRLIYRLNVISNNIYPLNLFFM